MSITFNISTKPDEFIWQEMSFEDYETFLNDHRQLWSDDPMWAQRVSPTFKFEVGTQYLTLEGKIVTIIKETSTARPCVMGSDDMWRYNCLEDLGRITGARWNCIHNLIPVPLATNESSK